jgi:hypothetical protein
VLARESQNPSFFWMAADQHSSNRDTDVMLIVTDGGEPYAVLKPFKLTAAGWVSSGKERRLPSRRCSGSDTLPAQRNDEMLSTQRLLPPGADMPWCTRWSATGQQETPALQKLSKAPLSGALAIGVAFQ